MDASQRSLLTILIQTTYRPFQPLEHTGLAPRATADLNIYRELFETQYSLLLHGFHDFSVWAFLPAHAILSLTRSIDKLLQGLSRLVNQKFHLQSSERSNHGQRASRTGSHAQLAQLVTDLKDAKVAVFVSGNTSLSLFFIASSEDASMAIMRIKETNELMKQTLASHFAFNPTPSSIRRVATQLEDVEAVQSSHQAQLGSLLDAMLLDFQKCQAGESRANHEVLAELSLRSHADMLNKPTDTMTIYLRCPNLDSMCRIQFSIDRSRQDHVKGKTRLCHHIETFLNAQEDVTLTFHENLSTFVPTSAQTETYFSRPPQITKRTLAELLQCHNGSPEGQKIQEVDKRMLAAKIVIYLGIFFPWRHICEPWNRDKIYFLVSDSMVSFPESPYISWKICNGLTSGLKLAISDSQEAADLDGWSMDDLPSNTRSFLIDSFNSLASLLLEIRFGPMQDRTDDSSLDTTGNPVKDYYNDIKRRRQSDAIAYLQAVDACLRFHRTYERERLLRTSTPKSSREEGPDETYRRLVLTEIVSKILEDITPEADRQEDPWHVEETKTSTSHHSDDSRDESDSEYELIDSDVGQVEQYGGSTLEKRIDQARAFLRSTFNRSASAESNAGRIKRLEDAIKSLNHGEGGILQDDHENLSLPEVREKKTDRWFKSFLNLTRAFEPGQLPGAKLKLAILDSGINYQDLQFDEDDDHPRIRERVSFIGDDPNMDPTGHGTHVAAIILRLTQNVDIYIAKITNTATVTRKDAVVQALRHAKTIWEVDMITMSFGFATLDNDDGIRQAVKDCMQDPKPIIVFASASNDGAEGSRTYPANIENVICVHTATFQGQDPGRNPPRKRGFNLSCVGELVRPIWGVEGLQSRNDIEYLGGTSYATPVAVSIAAFMIALIEVKGWSNWAWCHSPRSPQGMERIFQMMSVCVASGYDWVSPTRYLRLNSMETIEADLKEILVDDRDERLQYRHRT